MHKIFITALAAAVAVPTIASAQTGELRRDRQELREQQRDLRDAQRHGTRHDVRNERRDVREARREYREDWRDYRNKHRQIYRRPAYVGPRGYRYRVLTPGYRLPPAYYGSRYVIVDPHHYRLPRVSGHERWIRYGNDVVRVDTRTGRVLEVHQRFFF